MEPRSLTDLLGLVDKRMVGVTTSIHKPEQISLIQTYENVFEDYTRPSEQVFVNGINIYFMKSLKELQCMRPVVFTSEHNAQPRVLFSDKPITVHHTGPDRLEVGHRFTVIPPLCNVPHAAKFSNRYLLQTVEYDLFTRQFRQLIVWLRLFGEFKRLIANQAITSSSEYWRRLHLAANERLSGNTLWEDLFDAVQRDQKIENGGQTCRMIFDVSERYWHSYIGMNEAETAAFQKPFLTSRHVYDDLRTGLEATNAVDTTSFQYLQENVLEDNNASAVALTELINDQLKIHDALRYISTYADVFTPIEVGKIQSAASSVIKPGEKMDVMLCQSSW